MNRIRPFAWDFALCGVLASFASFAFASFAFAQASPGPAATGTTVQRSAGGTEWINGGGGEEERAAMAARQSEFPFKVVMSGAGGQFVVAEKLRVSTPQGELLAIPNAGPIVMIKLQPGAYDLEATWQGKTERRSVRVAASAQTLEWRLPG